MHCGPPSNLSVHVAIQSDTATGRASAFSDAAGDALRRPANWWQLAKFCAVGATGYVVNLAVFASLVHWADMHYIPAAICSFLVAVTNNYTLNRLWTFRHQRGHFAYQGLRFLVVSTIALGANLAFLAILVALGVPKVPAQAIAIALVTPWNFVANKLWSFRRRPAA
jgi:putative flippase GtrA